MSAASGKAAFAVVNKLDLATKSEREEALCYLHELLDGQGLGIFALSAHDGLAAKQQRNLQLLAASGLPAFEGELVRFLLNEVQRLRQRPDPRSAGIGRPPHAEHPAAPPVRLHHAE